jgi:hypothetical protein
VGRSCTARARFRRSLPSCADRRAKISAQYRRKVTIDSAQHLPVAFSPLVDVSVRNIRFRLMQNFRNVLSPVIHFLSGRADVVAKLVHGKADQGVPTEPVGSVALLLHMA